MSPVAPRKICRTPGCGKLTVGSYCELHEKKKEVEQKQVTRNYDKLRGTRTQRGYNSRWVRYSKAYREANPLCVKCKEQGKLTVANCVDHIVPVDGPDDPLFWEPSNHQSLCHFHHSEKTATEDGGFGNSIRRI